MLFIWFNKSNTSPMRLSSSVLSCWGPGFDCLVHDMCYTHNCNLRCVTLAKFHKLHAENSTRYWIIISRFNELNLLNTRYYAVHWIHFIYYMLYILRLSFAVLNLAFPCNKFSSWSRYCIFSYEASIIIFSESFPLVIS